MTVEAEIHAPAFGRCVVQVTFTKSQETVSFECAIDDGNLIAKTICSHSKLNEALKAMLFMLEGTSGMGAAYWVDFPQYLQAVRALESSGGLTKEEASSRYEVAEELADD